MQPKKTVLKVLLTGGGSGGHVSTTLSVYDALNRQAKLDNTAIDYLYIGSYYGLEKQGANSLAIHYLPINTGKLRRYLSWKNFIDFFKILIGCIQAFGILRKFKPDLIFSSGSYVSFPVVMAAKLLGIRIVIHEQTTCVGLANRIAGYFADTILLSFDSSKRYFNQSKTIHVGQPIRRSLFQGSPDSAYHRFKFSNSLPVIYITGGGQGSHLLNQVVLLCLNHILKVAQVVHQIGKHHHDFQSAVQFKSQLPDKYQNRYCPKMCLDVCELADLYTITDLIIGRSGAVTVCEAINFGIPAIWIPLSIATLNEQYINAKYMVDMGAALIIEEKLLNPNTFKNECLKLIENMDYRNRFVHNLKINKHLFANSDMKIVQILLKSKKND